MKIRRYLNVELYTVSTQLVKYTNNYVLNNKYIYIYIRICMIQFVENKKQYMYRTTSQYIQDFFKINFGANIYVAKANIAKFQNNYGADNKIIYNIIIYINIFRAIWAGLKL